MAVSPGPGQGQCPPAHCHGRGGVTLASDASTLELETKVHQKVRNLRH